MGHSASKTANTKSREQLLLQNCVNALQNIQINTEQVPDALGAVNTKLQEQKTAQEFKAKEQAYIALKNKREQEVYTKIREAAKAVMVEQKLDAIMDQRGVFVGGLDITDMVINKLKGSK